MCWRKMRGNTGNNVPPLARSIPTGLRRPALRALDCKSWACRSWQARSPGNPCAAHSLLRLGTGPSRPWLGRSPGRASTGHSSYSGSPTGLLPFPDSPTCVRRVHFLCSSKENEPKERTPWACRRKHRGFLCCAPALCCSSFACIPALAFLAWAFAGAAIHWIAAFYRTCPSALGSAKGVNNSDTYCTTLCSDFAFAQCSA